MRSTVFRLSLLTFALILASSLATPGAIASPVDVGGGDEAALQYGVSAIKAAAQMGKNAKYRAPNKYAEACAALKKYPAQDLAFLAAFGGPLGGVCEGTSVVTAEFEDACVPPRAGTPSLDRYSAKFRGISLETMLAKGWKVASSAEKTDSAAGALVPRDRATESAVAKFSAHFKTIKLRMGNKCCGNDQRCLKDFERVTYKFCRPSEKQSCVEQEEYWRPNLANAQNDALLMFNMAKYFPTVDQPEIRKRLETDIKSIASARESMGEGAKLSPPNIAADVHAGEVGTVFVAPYFSEDQFLTSDIVLEHELSHACSDIQRQQMLYSPKDTDQFASAYLRLYPKVTSDYCDLDLHQSLYSNALLAGILKSYGTAKEISAASSCIVRVAEASITGNKNRAKCENVCGAGYLEEAYAELNRLDWHKMREVMSRSCNTRRDSHHPMDKDLLECLIQSFPKVRRSVSEALGCRS